VGWMVSERAARPGSTYPSSGSSGRSRERTKRVSQNPRAQPAPGLALDPARSKSFLGELLLGRGRADRWGGRPRTQHSPQLLWSTQRATEAWTAAAARASHSPELLRSMLRSWDRGRPRAPDRAPLPSSSSRRTAVPPTSLDPAYAGRTPTFEPAS
jgi:hypothetical protein